MANSDRERILWQCIYTDNAQSVEDLLLSLDSEERAQLINKPLDFTHDLKKARKSIPVPDSLLRERLDIRRPWCLCGMFQAKNVASILLKVSGQAHLIILLPTGSEEKEVFGVGSIPVVILPSCQYMNTVAL